MTEGTHEFNKEQMKALIEAMLFISPNPLKLTDMYSVLKIPKKQIEEIVSEMMQENAFRGIEMTHENNSYYFKVKEECLDYVRKFNQNKEFSRAEIQTLSYIAYKNPVNQSEIIKTRGNRAYEHIKAFLKEGFIDLEPNGHTNEITVTRKFLNYFGMDSKEDLQQYFESRMMKNAKEGIAVDAPEELPLSNYSEPDEKTDENEMPVEEPTEELKEEII